MISTICRAKCVENQHTFAQIHLKFRWFPVLEAISNTMASVEHLNVIIQNFSWLYFYLGWFEMASVSSNIDFTWASLDIAIFELAL